MFERRREVYDLTEYSTYNLCNLNFAATFYDIWEGWFSIALRSGKYNNVNYCKVLKLPLKNPSKSEITVPGAHNSSIL